MTAPASLTVVLPPGIGLPTGRAARRFGRAEPLAGDVPAGYGYHATLCALWGLPVSGDADVPVAALGAAAELGAAPGTHWLRADPVVLVAARAELRLLADALAELPGALAQSLCDALARAQVLAQAGARWHVPHPARWYLELPTAPAVRTTPPAALLGANVQDGLPQGADAPVWRSALNAAQMALHQAQADLGTDQVPVSSVWFWGAGTVPQVASGAFTCVFAADPAARGLAVLGGAQAQAAAPADPAALPVGPALVAPDAALAPALLARVLAVSRPARVMVTGADAPAQVHVLAPRRAWWALWRR